MVLTEKDVTMIKHASKRGDVYVRNPSGGGEPALLVAWMTDRKHRSRCRVQFMDGRRATVPKNRIEM